MQTSSGAGRSVQPPAGPRVMPWTMPGPSPLAQTARRAWLLARHRGIAIRMTGTFAEAAVMAMARLLMCAPRSVREPAEPALPPGRLPVADPWVTPTLRHLMLPGAPASPYGSKTFTRTGGWQLQC